MSAPDGRSANERTVATYEALADRYLQHSSGRASAAAETLAASLPSGASVLELGSGPGLDADALEDAGLVVDRTDAALAFVERLRARGKAARVLNALSGDLGGPYDAVYASAVLLHFSRPELRVVLTSALHAVRPGGLLVATLKKGDGDEWSTRKMAAPRFFTYWQEEPLRSMLEGCGWQPLRVAESTAPTDSERWLTVIARRPGGGAAPILGAQNG